MCILDPILLLLTTWPSENLTISLVSPIGIEGKLLLLSNWGALEKGGLLLWLI